MTSLMGIGFYQFDNLIKNRVPFVLISYGVDFKNFDTGIFQNHLEKQLVLIEPKEIFDYVKKQKFSLEQSFILICTDGKLSQKNALKLEKMGYKNVFFINGGYQNLLKERDEY